MWWVVCKNGSTCAALRCDLAAPLTSNRDYFLTAVYWTGLVPCVDK